MPEKTTYKRRANMGDSNIYIVTYPSVKKYAEAEVREPVYYDKDQIERCPQCGAFLSGMKLIGEKMYTIRKKAIPDFLYVFGGTDYFVISEKALNVLRENGIKGINGVEKVDKIFYRKVPIEQTFYILTLERLDCPIDHEHSNFVYFNEPNERKCSLCDPMGRLDHYSCGFCFKPDVKIDMDIFNIYEMGGAIFLSERFLEVCEANGLTGLACHKITEYEDPVFLTEDEIAKDLSESRKMMGWEE